MVKGTIMNKKELEEAITGIGSIAELTAVFYKALINANISEYSAAHITGEYIKSFLPTILKG